MRVLEITSEMDGGGVDRLLYDYCRRMIPEIQFDFIVTSKSEGILEQPMKNVGCQVFHISQIHEDYKKHIDELRQILLDGRYDIVHDHSGYKAFVNLKVAKELGVKVRIAHSHQAYVPETFQARLIRRLTTPITKMYATDLFACGEDAAAWMWGRQQSKVYLVKNAINVQQFKFNSEKRNKIRNELGVTDKFVIGNVARFAEQKNHDFLVDIFNEVLSMNPDAILLLIGHGVLYDSICDKVKALNIDNNVIFLGIRDDVPDLLNAMDVFALPSLFEGLPVTLVEVQANGLPACVSSVITKEICIGPNMFYFDLNREPKQWAEEIMRLNGHRTVVDIESAGYEIESAALMLKEKYKKLCDIKFT